MPGHHVLVVPVPALEGFVRGRWQHYEPAWVSTDAGFTHAHVTALAPFAPRGSTPGPADLTRVAAIAAATPAFDFALAEVATFPNGCVHTRPEPSAPFADLTARLVAAFPDCEPYGGEFEPIPHLTLDHCSATVTEQSTREAVTGILPVRCRADRLELHWYEEGHCHVRSSWRLGVPPPALRRIPAAAVGTTHDDTPDPWRRNHGTQPSTAAREREGPHDL